MPEGKELLLPGLDGSNPLAFLAALGTWRITNKCYPGTRMRWTSHGGHWSPVLSFPERKPEMENYSKILYSTIRELPSNTVFRINKDLKISATTFHDMATNAILSDHNDDLSFISAFGSDAALDRYGNIDNTLFDLMNAGKQYFLQTCLMLITKTNPSDIKNTLFEAWTYPNDRGGMRWDPSEDRRYAYRWTDPQSDKTASQWGANRLAIEALPLLQTYPSLRRTQTTCFMTSGKKATFCSWPLWNCEFPLSICPSILGIAAITSALPCSHTLNEMGIVAVFRSQRIWKGKAPNDYSNFTPAVQIA